MTETCEIGIRVEPSVSLSSSQRKGGQGKVRHMTGSGTLWPLATVLGGRGWAGALEWPGSGWEGNSWFLPFAAYCTCTI